MNPPSRSSPAARRPRQIGPGPGPTIGTINQAGGIPDGQTAPHRQRDGLLGTVTPRRLAGRPAGPRPPPTPAARKPRGRPPPGECRPAVGPPAFPGERGPTGLCDGGRGAPAPASPGG